MKIYNTLSKEVETITSTSKDGKKIGLYACGPTVYDFAHIGHMRKYTMDDVLVRSLERADFAVTHVMNITDVGHLVSDEDTGEDKIERAARRHKKNAFELARFYEQDFWEKLDQMGIRRPDVAPTVTSHIAEQIKLIQTLEEKGFTYKIPGDGIYFDTSKDENYGELANLQLDQQEAGARIGEVAGKRQPADFALWKFSPADQQRQMEWDSPWGVGFPGWHIECSALSIKYLGAQVDIHTGGIDHIPVHHTNEIAQSENATGCRPFVRYWVHHNFLLINGQKMSKSLQNFYTLDDVAQKGFSPMALRMLFLSAHYRDELNFTWESLQAAQKGYERLQRRVQELLSQSKYDQLSMVPDLNSEYSAEKVSAARQQFRQFMEDDLKTPQALAVMWKLIKQKDPTTLPVLKEMFSYFGLQV